MSAVITADKQAGALEKEGSTLERQIKGIIEGCSTVKRLIEVWPEVTQFAPPELLSENNYGVLAIPREKVNELTANLGYAVDEKAK